MAGRGLPGAGVAPLAATAPGPGAPGAGGSELNLDPGLWLTGSWRRVNYLVPSSPFAVAEEAERPAGRCVSAGRGRGGDPGASVSSTYADAPRPQLRTRAPVQGLLRGVSNSSSSLGSLMIKLVNLYRVLKSEGLTQCSENTVIFFFFSRSMQRIFSFFSLCKHNVFLVEKLKHRNQK